MDLTRRKVLKILSVLAPVSILGNKIAIPATEKPIEGPEKNRIIGIIRYYGKKDFRGKTILFAEGKIEFEEEGDTGHYVSIPSSIQVRHTGYIAKYRLMVSGIVVEASIDTLAPYGYLLITSGNSVSLKNLTIRGG